MKRFLFCMTLALATVALAQEKEVELKEVMIRGARVVQQADRQIIYPSSQQLEASTSGYSLLNKLALPHIRIDEVSHAITSLGSTGGVEVRINDLKASTSDLLSMDMRAVESVEFIDHPGVRYGEGVAYVINIKVRHPVSGYVLGTDLTQGLTTISSNGSAYGKMNIGKSELGISYGASYQHTSGARSEEAAAYQLGKTTYDIQRSMTHSNYRSGNHNLQLSYSLSDSCYVFQARLSGSQPIGSTRYTSDHQYTENGLTTAYRNDSHGKTKSPTLDLYFHHDFRRHQSLTANAVGTYISSHDYSERNEGTPYLYIVQGDTYTLWTEAVYENRLKPFTVSAGLQYIQRYMGNRYEGDAAAQNRMHTSGIYGFGQLSGHLWEKLNYVAGMGISRRYFSQSSHHQDFILMRPKLSLSYPLARQWRLKYDFEISQHVSQIALVSNVRIKQNAMETVVGNPDIKPNRVTSHDLRLTYTTPRLMAELQAYYRLNAHCNMEKVIPTPSTSSYYDDSNDDYNNDNITTPFITTQANQRGCNFFFIQPYAQWNILPDRLTASIYCGLYRFFNYGDDYTHTYTSLNGAAWLQAYLNRWTLTAYADNGYRWMEGEGRGYQQPFWQLSASYRLTSQLTLALYAQRPFSAHPKTASSELMNRYIQKKHRTTDDDQGNRLTLNLTWHFSHGRQYRDIQRTLNHKETETGILKIH